MQSSERAPGTGPAIGRVVTVVLNWNGWHDTVACLESLRALDEVPRVIVVDNGSTALRIAFAPRHRGFNSCSSRRIGASVVG
jgi:hypothetical protein